MHLKNLKCHIFTFVYCLYRSLFSLLKFNLRLNTDYISWTQLIMSRSYVVLLFQFIGLCFTFFALVDFIPMQTQAQTFFLLSLMWVRFISAKLLFNNNNDNNLILTERLTDGFMYIVYCYRVNVIFYGSFGDFVLLGTIFRANSCMKTRMVDELTSVFLSMEFCIW